MIRLTDILKEAITIPNKSTKKISSVAQQIGKKISGSISEKNKNKATDKSRTKTERVDDVLNEAYGVNKLAADLEAWAKKAGLNFKKVSAKKEPGAYGATVTNTFYQIGDKFCLVRYETVAGAPRLNQLKFHVVDRPDMSAKSLGGANYVGSFGDVTDVLNKAKIVSSTKEVTTWNKQSIEKLIKDLQKDKQYRNTNDAEAFDIAKGILDDNEGLEKAIQQIYKVRDAQGWLANKI